MGATTDTFGSKPGQTNVVVRKISEGVKPPGALESVKAGARGMGPVCSKPNHGAVSVSCETANHSQSKEVAKSRHEENRPSMPTPDSGSDT